MVPIHHTPHAVLKTCAQRLRLLPLQLSIQAAGVCWILGFAPVHVAGHLQRHTIWGVLNCRPVRELLRGGLERGRGHLEGRKLEFGLIGVLLKLWGGRGRSMVEAVDLRVEEGERVVRGRGDSERAVRGGAGGQGAYFALFSGLVG